MTEFIKIAEAKANCKGSIKGSIIRADGIKSGKNSNTGKEWTRQNFLIEDDSASVDFVACGGDVGKFNLGFTYEITNPQWKMHNEVPQVQPSKFGSFKCVGSENTDRDKSATLEESQEHPKQVEDKTPKISESFKEFIEHETITMLQIEKEVRESLHHYKPLPSMQDYNGGYVGMFVKEIYRESRKANFKKAGDTN